MKRRITAAIAALALLSACSDGGDSTTTSSTATSTPGSATTTVPALSSTPADPHAPPSASAVPAEADGPMTPGAAADAPSVPIGTAPPVQPGVGIVPLAGGDDMLDASITGPMASIGVQLLPPTDVVEAFGLPEFPAPAGDNAVVLEATVKVNRTSEGISRSDRVAYMLQADVDLAASLDAAAAEMGIDGRYTISVDRTEEGNGAGDPVCEERTASPIDDPYLPLWTFGGCGDYADRDYAGLLALDVQRDTLFTGDLATPPVLDASIDAASPVLAATGGTVSGWSLTFGKPQGGDQGSTLAIELRVTPADASAAIEQLVSAALPDWSHAGSALWSNAAQSWTATGDLLVYRTSTRLGEQ